MVSDNESANDNQLTSHYDPVAAVKDKADFLLTFAGVQSSAEVCSSLSHTKCLCLCSSAVTVEAETGMAIHSQC